MIGERLRHLIQRHILSSIERKLAAAFMVVVLIPLLGTAFYGNWITSKILTDRAIANATADLEVRAGRIESYLAGIQADLVYLSNMDLLQDLVAARQQRDASRVAILRAQLGNQFALFARTHPEYYQIRYIAEDGQEFVRVNARQGLVEIVPLPALQLKVGRYYFQEAMRLQEGQIYISPVDLNREYGQLEFPYTPVIRYATPLFYPDGHRAGILIINVYADTFLRFVYDGRYRDEMIMMDQDGYYMVHPDPEKTWGHPWDRATGERVHLDFPRHWPELLAPSPGVVMTWDKVIVHMPVFLNPPDKTRYWVLLRVQPKPKALAPVQSFRLTAGSILLLAIIVSLLMAARLAHNIAAPIRLLTEQVQRLGRGETASPVPVVSDDEVGELARAFEEMATALQRHMDRLALLEIAGRRIMGHLDRERILQAVTEAMDLLFDAPCKVVRGSQPHTGRVPPVWKCVGEGEILPAGEREQATRARDLARSEGDWQIARIPAADGTITYMCCAAITTLSHHYGWLELYGPSPQVIAPATGNLLTSLAMQAAAALENADLYRRLEEHRERLRTLVEQLISVQEEERRVVAYDIHDGLIQRLVGARLHLLSLKGGDTFTDQDRHLLERAIDHLSAAIVEARRTIEGLRPPLLDELGLLPALEDYARALGDQHGWHLTVDASPDLQRLPESVEITAFRIAQEALNNAHKYAQAENVHIALEVDDGRLVLEVRDDGVGFDLNAVRHHKQCVGLTSMHERARLLGGSCVVESRPGQGTRVRAELPVHIVPEQ